MRYGLSFLASALALTATQAAAGIIVTSTQTNLSTHQTTPVTVFLEVDRLKVVMPDVTVIYRGDLNLLWQIQLQRRTYSEATAETMRQLGAQLASGQSQMAAAQSLLQSGLAGLPPEQRAAMEQMLAGRGMGLANLGAPPGPLHVEFAQTGNKMVLDWNCEIYRKTINGAQVQDICMARMTAAGLRADDLQVLDKISTFIEPVASSPLLPQTFFLGWTAMMKAIGYEAIPVEMVIYGGGAPASQQTVSKIERVAISENVFDLPAGLTKQDLSGIARGLR